MGLHFYFKVQSSITFEILYIEQTFLGLCLVF
uniref:Clone 1364 transcribed RNA sequence n=1 Tax=Plectreurys tristis TaxID=33319 RepID=A0A0C4W4E1_PLETR|nr:hypothetical protein [Plectreurys tristis]